MQKVPIMPTMPWQDGGVVSSPFEAAAEPGPVTETRLYLKSIMGVGLTLALSIGPILAALA